MGWMPREQWDALVRGDGCPLCAEIATNEPANEYGATIADLELSRPGLAANQWLAGYCVLICRVHVREPYELSRDDQIAYFEDMMRAGRALEAVFRPAKMNFHLLGNAVPHLHCHLIPRSYDDPAPSRPLDPNLGSRVLAPAERAERIAAIRSALGPTELAGRSARPGSTAMR